MIATTVAGSAMSKVFPNRCVAGRELAARLAGENLHNPIVLALPRGGVPVGYEVAHALGIPLDVLVVRKVGAPHQPELAIGAVGHGATVLDEETIALIGVPDDFIQAAIDRERQDVERRTALFRTGLPPLDLKGKTAVLVDDGLATGATAEAAVDVARHLGAERVIVAVPVASHEAVKRLRAKADLVISLTTPPFFRAVGYWYEDFSATEDAEVQRLLELARLEREAG
jgi:putative phosphoribosyl transferase